ncbi:hypothetical protein B0H14DRAFT_2830945 [Mycena olivaceomarginata]|nr:hypothetical protein B0H14DRAFT_2830945 [Mycena olivaceomarginata]
MKSTPPRLSKELHEELGSSMRGPIYVRDDHPEFVEYSSIFNGNVVCIAQAVACPLDAEDVSNVKAGGYGTAGWAVGGDIIIDISKFIDCSIEAPHPGGEDSALRFYDSASEQVANFLRGPYRVGWDAPQRDMPQTPVHVDESSRASLDSVDSGESSSDSNESTLAGGNQPSTAATTPAPVSPPPSARSPLSRPVVGGDPFGYLDAPTNPAPLPPSVTQSAYNPRSGSDPWGPRSGTLITNSSLPPVPLNLASQAEPIYPNAYVTFGAGMRQKEIDTFTAKHQLEARSLAGPNTTIPYHVPLSAHPVGSGVMLLGGFGFLSRLHGLSIDSLVEVEMVTADGQIRIVNENENPDLWWALRGAGPRSWSKAFPVPVVFAAASTAPPRPSLIRHFRDCVKGAPRELYANVLLTAGPEGKDSLIVEYLQALSSWNGERCLLNEVHEKSFLHQQDSVAQVLRGKPGRQWFIRSALISSLPDEIINETVIQFADTPVGCTWLFELAGGAILDFENNCVPKSQREAAFTIAALHQWEMTIDDDRCIDSAEEWIAGSLKSVQSGGPFPSFLGRHEPAERTIGCYGTNWDRLVEVKKKYDPKNVFRNSLWPLDANLERVDPRTHEPPTPHFLKFGH